MKSYKSMDGYNFFIQGWVGNLQVQVECKAVVVKASVRHSQSIASPLLHPWVAAERNGTIICAHCTCMAGLGEACSHIAAPSNEEEYILYFRPMFLVTTRL